MSDSFTVKLSGDKDIVAAFKDLKEYLPKQALRTAVRKSAQRMAQLIALVAPKLTGNLARNIVVKTKRAAQTMRGRVVINTVGKADNPQNAFYWRFLELGWHDRGGKQHREPFIQGVFEAKGQEAAQDVLDVLDDAIDRAEIRARRNLG